jgi:hypothetical protein
MTNLRSFFAVLVLGISPSARAQVQNFLVNPNADEGTKSWRAFGDATVETCSNGSPCFVLRNQGYFIQDVNVPEDAVGQYALLVGRATGEHLPLDGSITGRPYLYGYMMNAGDPSGGRIYAYLQGQQMSGSGGTSGQWETLYGVFKIPLGTARIRFFLQQAACKGNPHNAAVARFDELALYILPDAATAGAFVGDARFKPASTSTARCDAAREAIPPLYGLRLGMSLDQVLTLFPGNEEDPTVRRAVDLLQTRRVTSLVPMFLNPHRKGPNFELQEIENFFLVFDQLGLYRIEANYREPGVSSVDEFIEKYRHLLNMPEPDKWEAVQGNAGGNQSKYRICDGVEVRYFLARNQSAKPSRISVIDTTLEGKLRTPPILQKH